MELYGIDAKIEDEALTMILLASFPPSNKNFVSSLSIGKDSINTWRSQDQSLFQRASTKSIWEWWWSLCIWIIDD